VHSSIHDAFLERLAAAYSTVTVGHPLDSSTLCGPLHTPAGVALFRTVLERVPQEGGRLVAGGTVLTDIAGCEQGNFVQPALVSMPAQQGPLVLEENFVPVSVCMCVCSVRVTAFVRVYNSASVCCAMCCYIDVRCISRVHALSGVSVCKH
jgi:acyl-CoA reductase-like NAD-dependent aldehyde dehydrogenase